MRKFIIPVLILLFVGWIVYNLANTTTTPLKEMKGVTILINGEEWVIEEGVHFNKSLTEGEWTMLIVQPTGRTVEQRPTRVFTSKEVIAIDAPDTQRAYLVERNDEGGQRIVRIPWREAEGHLGQKLPEFEGKEPAMAWPAPPFEK